MGYTKIFKEENFNLDRFLSNQYKDYKEGDPQQAAKVLKNVMNDNFIEYIQNALISAGKDLAPIMKKLFIKDIIKKLENIKI